ncbi:MAG: hypothetical protein K0R48_623 [Gammaproteobacteria bacterium]|jgi:hypothetical protein|nr:hypothetical protein [Gammaproteobacteria bacterium]
MLIKAKITEDLLMQKTTKQYLQQHYCTLEHLLKTCDLSETEFFAYIDAQCLPKHSYEWQERSAVSSFLGKHEWVEETILYYHPRHVLLLHDLITWHRYMVFEDIAKAVEEDFKVHYIAKAKELDAFSDVLSEYVDKKGEMKQAALEEFLDGEWRSYLEGIYGLCTNEPTAENIATKEMMWRRIRLITADGSKATLNDQERVLLKQTIQILDGVLTPFAPYERAHSSREKWINAVIVKYF